MTGASAADAAARALCQVDAGWYAAMPPPAVVRPRDGVLLALTPSRVTPYNALIVHDPGAPTADVAEGLDEALASGLPFALQLRPGSRPEHVRLARDRGLTGSPVPIMSAEPAALSAPDVPALRVRELEPAEVWLHLEIIGVAFDAPDDVLASLDVPGYVGGPSRAYVADLDGRPVATALGVTVGDAVGVFAVGTLPEARRRGIGAALTARAVADGAAAGARLAVLQASTSGRPV